MFDSWIEICLFCIANATKRNLHTERELQDDHVCQNGSNEMDAILEVQGSTSVELRQHTCQHKHSTRQMNCVPLSQMMGCVREMPISNAVTTVEGFARVIAQRTLHLIAAPMTPILVLCSDVKIFGCTKT